VTGFLEAAQAGWIQQRCVLLRTVHVGAVFAANLTPIVGQIGGNVGLKLVSMTTLEVKLLPWGIGRGWASKGLYVV